jgi:Trk K+ transport system NAD-binding subunit
MDRTRRHGIYYILAVVVMVLLYTVLYQYGMAYLEGVQRGFFESLHVVVESITTTGYGEDAPWSTTPMLVLMILMQFTGVFFFFLTLPLFLIPWIERRIEDTLPQSYDGTDHVVICGLSEVGDQLVDELESHDVDYVVLVEDPDRVGSLLDAGHSAVLGDPESATVLSNVSVESARAVILDTSDERNATIALTVREIAPAVRLVAFVEDRTLVEYLELAGVDAPLQPRELLGEGLAKEVSRVITTQLGDTVDIGADFEVIELPVSAGAAVEGRTIATAGLREETGATILGAWLDGEFVPNPDPSRELDRHAVLLVAGTNQELQAAMELTVPSDRLAHRDTVVAGYGDTGRAVCATLESSYIACSVIDERAGDHVDVVGDATEADVLREAGIESAGALIVAVGNDTDAIFITLVARELNPDLEIVVRANDVANRSKLVAAGADYVLPLAEVAARMLADTILGEDVISYETQIEIVRISAPAFVGQTLAEAAIRERTGCTVIAVEREESVRTDLGPDFEIERGDTLVVVGTDEDLLAFRDAAGVDSTS